MLTPGSLHSFTRAAMSSCRPSLARPPRGTQRDPVGATSSGAERPKGPTLSALRTLPAPRLGSARPAAAPRPGRGLGWDVGGARPPGLHSRALGLRRLPPRDPAGPVWTRGSRAARASGPAEPYAIASCPSREGPGCRAVRLELASWPWARWPARGRRLPPAPATSVAPTWSLTSPPTRSSLRTPSTSCEFAARPPALRESSESLLFRSRFPQHPGEQASKRGRNRALRAWRSRSVRGYSGVKLWSSSWRQKVSLGGGRIKEPFARISGKLWGNLKVQSSLGSCLWWPSDSWAGRLWVKGGL